MGKNYGPVINYYCTCDCQQMGCPGHTVRAVFHRSSDILSFEIDGNDEYSFDENKWNAMVKSADA